MIDKRSVYSLLIVLCLSCNTLPSVAQSTPKPGDDSPIRVKTQFVNVPIIVSDKDGRRIAGLGKDDFTVLVDGEKQPIEYFANDDVPLSVAIVVDTSYSTRPVLQYIKDAAYKFVNQLRPVDQAMIVSFDYDTKVRSEFTSDPKQLKKAIGGLSTATRAGSNMNDAVDRLVRKEFEAIKDRKAIIVLTDGFVGGIVTNRRLLQSLIESDTLVYPILFQTFNIRPRNVRTIPFEALIKMPPFDYLNSLAVETGGRLFAAGGDKFKSAFQSIADELRTEYVLGFYLPENERTGKNRIGIGVNRTGAGIRSKRIIQLKEPAAAPN